MTEERQPYKGYWYSPERALRSEGGIIFVLYYYDEIKTGYWPSDFTSGYTDAEHSRQKTIYYQGNWENIVAIGADLDIRLEMTGRDGDMLVTVYYKSIPADELARMLNFDQYELDRRLENALEYCKGKRRRIVTYKEFLDHKKYPTFKGEIRKT